MSTNGDDDVLGETYLLKRGVLVETFLLHGGEIDSSPHCAKISERLNRNLDAVRLCKDWKEVKEILWIPVSNCQVGRAYWLARPLPAFKKLKFVAPVGSDSLPWIPQKTRDIAKDIDSPIVITEGPIKAMGLLQAGALPISLQGVWGSAEKKKAGPERQSEEDDEGDADTDRKESSDKGEKLNLHPELARFDWEWRQVLLCLDADRFKNKNVRQAEIRLAFLLHSAGAEIYQLSTWTLEEGKGVDDYLARRAGTDPEKQCEAFAELLGRAIPFHETLTRHDIDLAKKELHRTQNDRAKFEQLASLIAKPLETTKAGLGAFRGDPEKEKSGHDMGGAQPVDIPPTATPWDGKVDAKEVLDLICAAIDRFVWVKPSQSRAVALWIVLSYLHGVVDILPLLLITSPEEECGKSTLAELILDLSNRPIGTSNISSAAVYRTIKDNCPTLILDEADTYLKEDEILRGVINSGHKRKFAFVIRVINDRGETGRFSTWCPKVIAMIGLPKRTILGRSIHIRLGRKPEDIKTDKLKEEHYHKLEDLRRKISRLANDIRSHVKAFRDESLENRAGDNWQPLFAIAAAAGEEWLQEAKLAAQRISKKDAEEMKGFGRYLLESLDHIIQEKRKKENLEPTEKIFLRSLDLCNELNQDQEAPWKDKQDGIDALRLSKALKEYDIIPKRTREGSDRSKGYWSDEIEKAVQQYVRSPD